MRLAWLDELQPNAGSLRPQEDGLAGKLRAIVHDDFLGQAMQAGQLVKKANHPLP